MSFFVNNVELKQATFNQQEVKSIYFNTHLIWEAPSFEWPGWANATWEDVYNLCKQKQNGGITAWPDDVVLGATKETTLSTAILGTSTFTMRIIGLDIDGSGVITFDSKYVAAETTSCNLFNRYENNFYNYCNAKPYIKSLKKGTAPTSAASGDRNGGVTYADHYVWSLSEREVNLDRYSCISVANSTLTKAECTYGVNQPYPYFTSNESRKKRLKEGDSPCDYWGLRSGSQRNTLDGGSNVTITYWGNSDWVFEGITDISFSPCFAIG